MCCGGGSSVGHPFKREGAGTGNFRKREKCHHLIKSQQGGSFNISFIESAEIPHWLGFTAIRNTETPS